MAPDVDRFTVPQPMLTGLEVPDTGPAALATRRGSLTVRQVAAWARRQVASIARVTHTDRNSDLMIYAQAAKLVEEVGELHAELLGRSKRQRATKAQVFDQASLEAELADVILATTLLAEILHVDLAEAISDKIAAIDRRRAQEQERLAPQSRDEQGHHAS